jgi:16S rRNA (cytidine1402-2'-O)-methyltransferase
MGKLYVVATPIGNLKDITYRAVEILNSCSLIAAEDTRNTMKLLKRYGIKTPLISYYEFNEEERARILIDYILEKDIDISIVSDAGTPCISDPGYKVVRLAREKGIDVIGIPGPSAVMTALSISGLPVSRFSFYGFLPRGRNERKEILKDIRERGIETFVLYESPKRILELAELILNELPEAQVCFCCELTKVFERSFYGSIGDVFKTLENEPNVGLGEYTIVVYSPYRKREENVQEISIEALLVDTIVKKGCTLKEAIELVSKDYKISKKEVYKRSLELKRIIR